MIKQQSNSTAMVFLLLGDDGGAGHNVPYARAAIEAGRRAGWVGAVCVSRKSSIQPVPIGWRKCIDTWGGPAGVGRLSNFIKLAKSISTAIRSLTTPARNAVVVIDSFTVLKLFAAIYALVKVRSIVRKVIIIHRYDYSNPFERFGYGVSSLVANGVFGKRYAPVTDSDDLAVYLEPLLRRELLVLPIPHTFSAGYQQRRLGDDIVCWLPGQALPTKGLLRVQALLQSKGLAAPRIVVRVADGPILETLEGGVRLERVRSGLSEGDYAAMMAESDVVILPYMADSYSRRTSGIFIEAVCAGKLVVASEGTWISKQLKAAGLNECILDWSRCDLPELIVGLVCSSEAKSKFATLAARYRQFHTIDSYAEQLCRVLSASQFESTRLASEESSWISDQIIGSMLRGLFAIVSLLDRVTPKIPKLVISSYPDLDDQITALLRQISRKKIAREVCIIHSGEANAVRARYDALVRGPATSGARVTFASKLSLRGIWNYLRADAVLFTHGLYESDLGRSRRKLVINVWHGVPIKGLWRANKRSGERDSAPSCSVLVSSSEFSGNLMKKLSGTSPAQVLTSGLPRNDLLLQCSRIATELRRGLWGEKKTVIGFLPTFRRSRTRGIQNDGLEHECPLMLADSALERLRGILSAHGAVAWIKPHPLSVHYGTERMLKEDICQISNSWLQENFLTLYDLLSVTDILITDVSSVYVDFLVTQKPVLFHFPDFSEYAQSRGFSVHPIEDFLPGPLVKTDDELLASIQNVLEGADSWRESRRRLRALLNAQDEPTACRRVLTLLN